MRVTLAHSEKWESWFLILNPMSEENCRGNSLTPAFIEKLKRYEKEFNDPKK